MGGGEGDSSGSAEAFSPCGWHTWALPRSLTGPLVWQGKMSAEVRRAEKQVRRRSEWQARVSLVSWGQGPSALTLVSDCSLAVCRCWSDCSARLAQIAVCEPPAAQNTCTIPRAHLLLYQNMIFQVVVKNAHGVTESEPLCADPMDLGAWQQLRQIQWNSLPRNVVMASGLEGIGDWAHVWKKSPSQVHAVMGTCKPNPPRRFRSGLSLNLRCKGGATGCRELDCIGRMRWSSSHALCHLLLISVKLDPPVIQTVQSIPETDCMAVEWAAARGDVYKQTCDLRYRTESDREWVLVSVSSEQRIWPPEVSNLDPIFTDVCHLVGKKKAIPPG